MADALLATEAGEAKAIGWTVVSMKGGWGKKSVHEPAEKISLPSAETGRGETKRVRWVVAGGLV